MNHGAFSYSGTELEALAGAKNYYCWILSQFHPYVGKRTIEVGAGIGTISELLLAQTALDQLIVVEPAHNLFPWLERRLSDNLRVTLVRGHVDDVPGSIGVDCVILVNVLEHVDDVTTFLATWFVAGRLLRQTVIPWISRLEARWAPPFGQRLLAVAARGPSREAPRR